MSTMTPQEVEAKALELLNAGRDEVPSAALTAKLDEILQGTAPGLADDSLTGPPMELDPKRRWRWWLFTLIILLLLLFSVWRISALRSAHTNQEPAVPRGIAAANVPPSTPTPVAVAAADASVEPEPVRDAGLGVVSLDAGVTQRPVVPKVPRPTAVEEDDDDALARELALLDQARKELAAKNAEQTLKTLTRHRSDFPRGSLKLEADLVRVEALLALDRRAEAETLATRLRTQDTQGLIRERLRRLMDASQPTP